MADLGLLVLLLVIGVLLISIAQIAVTLGTHALFGPPDPATQMTGEEAGLASYLDRGGLDVDYVDFEPEQVTVFLREVRGEQMLIACRMVLDDYHLSKSYRGQVAVHVASGRNPMSARIGRDRGDC